MRLLLGALLLAVLASGFAATWQSRMVVRGGMKPAAKSEDEYFKQYEIDYGIEDSRRTAGQLRGLVRKGNLQRVKHTDEFVNWLCSHLEEGTNLHTKQHRFKRLKPFYAADFGTSKDRKRGENPKLIIVKRLLASNSTTGQLLPPPKELDVEIREIWQPWLKHKCDFVVRYIVPNREAILKIMESKGRFVNELVVDGEQTQRSPSVRMTFKPSWMQRLLGKSNIVITHPLDKRILQQSE